MPVSCRPDILTRLSPATDRSQANPNFLQLVPEWQHAEAVAAYEEELAVERGRHRRAVGEALAQLDAVLARAAATDQRLGGLEAALQAWHAGLGGALDASAAACEVLHRDLEALKGRLPKVPRPDLDLLEAGPAPSSGEDGRPSRASSTASAEEGIFSLPASPERRSPRKAPGGSLGDSEDAEEGLSAFGASTVLETTIMSVALADLLPGATPTSEATSGTSSSGGRRRRFRYKAPFRPA